MNQSSVIDRNGVVYSQVYGVTFELPWLVEPLKELVFNRPSSAGHLFAGLIDRVKLFCTVYDPATGRYRFDNSLFVQIAVGASMILAILFYLLNEVWIKKRVREKE
jgi:protein SCO1/2